MSSGAPLIGRVLVVEDDRPLRDLIAIELGEAGLEVATAEHADAARGLLATQAFDLVVSDLRLPDASGLDLLSLVKESEDPPAFVIITAFGTVEQAVTALKRGADDFLTKPLDLDHLALSVERNLERRTIDREYRRYQSLIGGADFHGVLGRSPVMRRLFEQIQRIARASGPVLLSGESGVGKEMVARAIHAESERRREAFVAINCAGIPAELLESELFGHAAGAFTGAQRARRGLFAEADKGTLLLDEIGEMPTAMQAKLLRVLQDGQARAVGENRERVFDVRVIAATNRDLEQEIEAGRFRADLFYRLETFSLSIPPLRERGEDIELLTAFLVARFGKSCTPPVCRITEAAMQCLKAYSFPGNVRELSNAIERAVVFCRTGEIDIDDLPERIRGARPQPQGDTVATSCLDQLIDEEEPLPTLRELERRYVAQVLERVDQNKRQAAKILGIGRRTLYRYLDER
ncbi:sigma-54 dependent transcriptional regulator [Thioalkalicoccus limnaeus]|uniref:Sigma-54 dependent transcriptional regulator n=1 Tax=Thioalkalicoccus limnaeus TaxID=120681 RepID=A0ABV4BEP1_9GAMM